MATVTMTGKEYGELLRKLDDLTGKLDEVIKWTTASTKVTFPADDTWHPFVFQNPGKMPEWLRQAKINSLCTNLVSLSNDELREWVAGGRHYYNPEEDHLQDWDGGEDTVDLLEVYELGDLWEEVWNELHPLEIPDEILLEDAADE